MKGKTLPYMIDPVAGPHELESPCTQSSRTRMHVTDADRENKNHSLTLFHLIYPDEGCIHFLFDSLSCISLKCHNYLAVQNPPGQLQSVWEIAHHHTCLSVHVHASISTWPLPRRKMFSVPRHGGGESQKDDTAINSGEQNLTKKFPKETGLS